MSSFPRSTILGGRNPHIPFVPKILSSRHSTPREDHTKSTSHKLDDCYFCVPSSSSTFQIDDSPSSEVFIPDIKSFSLPRAQSEVTAKIPERYLESGNSRRTFSNGTKKEDFQWLSMRATCDPYQNENEKLHNYTNYQIVCMLQNIDDIARMF